MRVFSFVFIIALFCANILQAQSLKYTIKKGQTINVASHSFFNGTCKKTKKAHFKVPKKIKLGSIKVEQRAIKIRQVNDDHLIHCIGKSVKGAVVIYTAGQKAGVEKFSISRRRESGPNAHIPVVITIR